nr:hypothetical protein [uncultured bacterium]
MSIWDAQGTGKSLRDRPRHHVWLLAYGCDQ